MNNYSHDELLSWLLKGDVSIRYQTYRDLLGKDRTDLRDRITKEGWGNRFLSKQKSDGHWGRAYYQPKWTSTHYTLLDLKNLSISPNILSIRKIVESVLKNLKGDDGGIYPVGKERKCDVCMTSMFLNCAAYFGADENYLKSLIDFLLTEQMPDGGFNCHSNTKGAVHSSVHTTLSVLEGLAEFRKNGYKYRANSIKKVEREAHEFLLYHKLYQSHRTGEPMDKKMLMLSYPSRWRYDILRSLDYFRYVDAKYDPRMDDAVTILLKKRRDDGRWPLQARHPGQTHFEMEKTGEPSRWNTLRTMRVLKHFGINI